MALLAPRIGNEVSYVTHIIEDIHFAWQAQVVPGRAGGGSFKRQKNHIAEKDFAYRMCAMSNIFFAV